jgi:hypothetical protein
MKNVSDKVVEKIKTHILFSVTFFENYAVELMWKNIVEWGRPHDNIIQHMCITCWIPQVTNIHTQGV